MMTRRIINSRWNNVAWPVIATVALLVVGISQVQSHQFRSLNPIASPSENKSGAADSLALEEIQPIERGVVESMVRDIIGRWNTADMAKTLSDSFFDRNRLLDSVDNVVPRDAKLRLQSVQGIQTVQQYIEPAAEGQRSNQVSIVSVTVRTQLEFNDPSLGFVRRSGTNEFILKVTRPAP